MKPLCRRPLAGRCRAATVLAVVSAGAMAASACSNDSSAGGGDATVLEVDLGPLVIDPAVLTAPAGPIELRVTNVDPNMVHDLVVASKGTRRLAPGESQTLQIPAPEPGEYRMWCDVPGHAAAGQTGTLVVEADTAAAAP